MATQSIVFLSFRLSVRKFRPIPVEKYGSNSTATFLTYIPNPTSNTPLNFKPTLPLMEISFIKSLGCVYDIGSAYAPVSCLYPHFVLRVCSKFIVNAPEALKSTYPSAAIYGLKTNGPIANGPKSALGDLNNGFLNSSIPCQRFFLYSTLIPASPLKTNVGSK